jgi:DNA polymerase-3 subunit delta
MDAFAFLAQDLVAPEPVYVLAGPEAFLKRLALARLTAAVIGTAPVEFARSVYEPGAATFAEVRDELETLPFLSPRRLVIVTEADGFVSDHRESLEAYVRQPSRSGVLVLEVRSWKSNTRLARLVPAEATVTCETPAAQRLPAWCRQWSAAQHGKQLGATAANLLVELVGPELGVLDQELAKLSTYVGDRAEIQPRDVDTLVGHSRVETAWRMLDAVAAGQTRQALTTLAHLLDQGEEPIAILGAMSWQLRRLAQVARLSQQGVPLADAMSRAGLPPFARQRTEQQLRHLGPQAFRLYDWLLEADLALKSSGQLKPRAVLERLLIKLASPRPAPSAATRDP